MNDLRNFAAQALGAMTSVMFLDAMQRGDKITEEAMRATATLAWRQAQIMCEAMPARGGLSGKAGPNVA